MAMICIYGTECTGCMRCEKEPVAIAECAHCDEAIFEWEDYYNIEGETIHDECLIDWAKQYQVKAY